MLKPSQLGLFEASLQPKPAPKSARRQPKAALKITSPSVQAKVKVQPEVRLESKSNLFSAPYGHCRICGSWTAIPGLDASLCSHSACGSSGWVVDSAWLAANPRRGGKGGAA